MQDTLLFVIDFFSALFPSLSSLAATPSTGPTSSTNLTSTDDARGGMSIRYTRESEAVEIHPQEIGIEAAEDEEDETSDVEMEDDRIRNRSSNSGDPSPSANVGPSSTQSPGGGSKSRQVR